MSDAAAAAAAAGITPPGSNVLGLTTADLIFSSIFFPLCAYIAWRHGKNGMVAWGIIIFAFAARIVADAYLWTIKDDPLLPTAVSTMTGAAVNACFGLGFIGMVYMRCVFCLPASCSPSTLSLWMEPEALDMCGSIPHSFSHKTQPTLSSNVTKILTLQPP